MWLPASKLELTCDPQWLNRMILARYKNKRPEGEHPMCTALEKDEGAALRAIMNGPDNMWGVPKGVSARNVCSTCL